jgi:outer membrane protein TolC
MKKLCAFLVLVMLSAAPVLADQPEGKITMEQAILKALTLHADYSNSLLSEKESGIQTDIADKKRRLSLDFDSTYRYVSDTMEVKTPSIEIPGLFTVPSNSITAGVFHNFDVKLGARQPLYSGGILKNMVRLSEVQKSLQSQQSRLRRLDVAASVKSAYFQHQALIRRRQSLEALKKNLTLHAQRLERLFTEGLVRKTDLLETRTRLEEADIRLTELLGQIRESEIRFQSACGYPPGDIINSYREPEMPLAEAELFVSRYHPVLSSLDMKLQALDLQLKVTKGRYRPQINGFAELHYGRPGIDYFKKEWSLYFAGGLALRLPVFDWKRLQNEKDMNRLRAKKIINEREEFLRELHSGLEALYEKLDVLDRMEAGLGRIIGLGNEDVEMKSRLVKERQIPNIDYLSALLLLEQKTWQKEELQLSKEMIKVRINTLIGYLED